MSLSDKHLAGYPRDARAETCVECPKLLPDFNKNVCMSKKLSAKLLNAEFHVILCRMIGVLNLRGTFYFTNFLWERKKKYKLIFMKNFITCNFVIIQFAHSC
jgi:hypothetical protein